MYNRIEDFMLTIGWWQNYQSQSKKLYNNNNNNNRLFTNYSHKTELNG